MHEKYTEKRASGRRQESRRMFDRLYDVLTDEERQKYDKLYDMLTDEEREKLNMELYAKHLNEDKRVNSRRAGCDRREE